MAVSPRPEAGAGRPGAEPPVDKPGAETFIVIVTITIIDSRGSPNRMKDGETLQEHETAPLRDGLFVDGGSGRAPKLVGSRCRETGAVYFPAEVMNPDTRRTGTMEPVEIDGRGRLVSYTVVARGLPGFEAPYALGVIALEAGPSLIAQLADWERESLRCGMPVEMTIGTIRTGKDGIRYVGPKFRPVDGRAA